MKTRRKSVENFIHTHTHNFFPPSVYGSVLSKRYGSPPGNNETIYWQHIYKENRQYYLLICICVRCIYERHFRKCIHAFLLVSQSFYCPIDNTAVISSQGRKIVRKDRINKRMDRRDKDKKKMKSRLLQLDRVKRIWCLSPMRAAKVQASLRIRAVSPEPSLLAHTSSESRGTFRQKARSLAPLNGWACAVKTCHDGMPEDTNSLDAAQLIHEQHAFALQKSKATERPSINSLWRYCIQSSKVGQITTSLWGYSPSMGICTGINCANFLGWYNCLKTIYSPRC